MNASSILSRLSEYYPGCIRWIITITTGILLLECCVIKAEAQLDSVEKLSIKPEAVEKFFERFCHDCHAGTDPEGDFQIENLSTNFEDKVSRDSWLAVLDQLEAGEMPPKRELQPGDDEIRDVVEWIRDRAGQAERNQRKSTGRVVLRR